MVVYLTLEYYTPNKHFSKRYKWTKNLSLILVSFGTKISRLPWNYVKFIFRKINFVFIFYGVAFGLRRPNFVFIVISRILMPHFLLVRWLFRPDGLDPEGRRPTILCKFLFRVGARSMSHASFPTIWELRDLLMGGSGRDFAIFRLKVCHDVAESRFLRYLNCRNSAQFSLYTVGFRIITEESSCIVWKVFTFP